MLEMLSFDTLTGVLTLVLLRHLWYHENQWTPGIASSTAITTICDDVDTYLWMIYNSMINELLRNLSMLWFRAGVWWQACSCHIPSECPHDAAQLQRNSNAVKHTFQFVSVHRERRSSYGACPFAAQISLVESLRRRWFGCIGKDQGGWGSNFVLMFALWMVVCLTRDMRAYHVCREGGFLQTMIFSP